MDKQPKKVYKLRVPRRCNCCGELIQQVTPTGLYADYLSINKKWGYFSNKDLTRHSFCICESCYDKWVKTFAIPIEEIAVTEVFENMDDI